MSETISPEVQRELLEAGVVVEANVPYLGDGRKEKLDLYRPVDPPAGIQMPGVVMIHGGGWSGGDKANPREINICKTLVQNGFIAVSINYLMKNDNGLCWPTNLHDCKDAVRFLRANAEQYHIDTDHIGAIGGSAGGHLAAMLGVTDDDWMAPTSTLYPGYSSQVQAIVNMYGPVDLVMAGWNIDWMLGTSVDEDPAPYYAFSPKFLITPQTPPTLILHGTADTVVPVEQAEMHAEALSNAGVEHHIIIIPDAPHSFDFEPAQRDLRPVVFDFLNRHLRPDRNHSS